MDYKHTDHPESIGGNIYDKYHSGNPFVKWAIRRFMERVGASVKDLRAKTILDCGCGEGFMSDYIYAIKRPANMVALDIDEHILQEAKKKYSHIDFLNASIYDLPYEDDTFDLIISLETLEHLHSAGRALDEMLRIGKRYFIFSVPMEPYWHFINILGGKYLNKLGNTPGHVNFWTKKGFISYLKQRFKIIKDLSSFPWTIVLCEKAKR